MKLRNTLALYLIVGFLAIGQLSAQVDQTMRILFVGNSFIYFNNLPQVVMSMAESQGVPLYIRQSTVGGSSLTDHWKEEKGTRTMELLKTKQWDYVVMNNHSLSAIETPDEFFQYGKNFAELVKERGAVPVFMLTWGYQSNPLMQRQITEAYQKLADQTGAQFVSAGELMAQARFWRPDMNLFHDDKHPSPNGTYLIGLAFFKYFTGKSTANIPPRLTTRDRDDELLYLLFMSQENADFLQQLVDEFEMKTLKK